MHIVGKSRDQIKLTIPESITIMIKNQHDIFKAIKDLKALMEEHHGKKTDKEIQS